MRKIQIKKKKAIAVARAQLFSNSCRHLQAGPCIEVVVDANVCEFLLIILLYGCFVLFLKKIKDANKSFYMISRFCR